MEDSVKLLGPVEKKMLRILYTKCLFLVFPSPYENFAYTLIEAMCCGAAIVCSDTTAMPETCGDAALYFDPHNTRDISKKMIILLRNEKLRNNLKKLALAKSKKYPNFKEVSNMTLEIIHNYH